VMPAFRACPDAAQTVREDGLPRYPRGPIPRLGTMPGGSGFSVPFRSGVRSGRPRGALLTAGSRGAFPTGVSWRCPRGGLGDSSSPARCIAMKPDHLAILATAEPELVVGLLGVADECGTARMGAGRRTIGSSWGLEWPAHHAGHLGGRRGDVQGPCPRLNLPRAGALSLWRKPNHRLGGPGRTLARARWERGLPLSTAGSAWPDAPGDPLCASGRRPRRWSPRR